ncbi:MAG: ParB/RepB/Spo0J family partition protein [Oscillospiraceae bacterium]|uniref:ParB/RepB/Spo0J family partition protein n=1 Tax=Faecousia sp. TaxID=2952921 RepID=UPI003A1DBD92
MKNDRLIDLGLTGYEELFMSTEERLDAKKPKVEAIPLAALTPFRNHPFKVKEDEEMAQLMRSIADAGVLSPALARPLPDGGYELISGHRRLAACKALGMGTMPVIIRDLTDEEAVITMVDSNLQREHILPSEKAFAYKMKYDAIKRSPGRKENGDQLGHQIKSIDSLAENSPDSRNQIQRYIRLTNLIPDILKLVDEGKIALTPAVELSYLQPSEQEMLFSVMDSDEVTPSLSQARRLRRMSEAQTLTDDAVLQLLSEVKGNQVEYVKVPVDKLRSFFRPDTSMKQMTETLGFLQQTLGAAAQRPGRPVKGDFTMKEIIKEIIEFDLDEGRMDYLDDMIDVFSKDGCEMVDILFDRFLKKYYADIDVSNERMTINLTDEEGHVLSFNLSQSEVHYVLHMVERRLNSFMRDDGGGGFSDED